MESWLWLKIKTKSPIIECLQVNKHLDSLEDGSLAYVAQLVFV
jgi:hypothetical protein